MESPGESRNPKHPLPAGRTRITPILPALVALARGLANPARALRKLLRRVPKLPLEVKVALDLYGRPHYAYGIWCAASQAKALGLPAITCIEFGVGTGQGLLAMEAIAEEIEAHTAIRIDVFGFDSGQGLPRPRDYRDLPYVYQSGFYSMDQEQLRARLTRARLVIGPVADTVPQFFQGDAATLGFVACDLDYYSSTIESFAIFDSDTEHYLPRVVCYFDDVANAEALQCEFTGEELAIRDFNDAHDSVKIGAIRGLQWSRAIPASWNDQMYACHFFGHPDYGRHVLREATLYVQPLDGRS
jgi:hypothetical protein